MWMNPILAFAALTLISSQPGSSKLSLTHVRMTHGVLGISRLDNKFLPGDNFVLAFDIQGIKIDDRGKALYSITMEVTDAKGIVQFKQDPRDLEADNSLGGSILPAFASLQIGLQHPPGIFKVKVTATDRVGKTSQSLTRTYEVLPPGFGLVHLSMTSDPEGGTPAPFVGQGQSLWINFALVGFERDPVKKQPNLALTMRVLDEEAKPTLAKSFEGEAKQEIPAEVRSLPLQFVLGLNRAGKFTIELEAIDKVSGKKTALSFPLTVLMQP